MNFLLVHGGGTTGKDWQEVAGILKNAGHKAWCPNLGNPARSTLQDHVDTISRKLEEISSVGRVVIAGHSYGGMVVSEAAMSRPDSIDHIYFLDAAVPEPGKSNADIIREAGFDPDMDFKLDDFRPYHDPSHVDWTQLKDIEKTYIYCANSFFSKATGMVYDHILGLPEQENWQAIKLELGHHGQKQDPELIACILMGQVFDKVRSAALS